MNVFTKNIDAITIDDIEMFISEKHPENIRLEYKQCLSSKDANFQIAKEVAAFANQQGGVILFGVVEDEKTRRPLSIEGIDKTLKLRDRIQSVCIDHIYPPIVPEIQECELKSDSNKVVVLVRIEMSDAVPHTINNKTGFYLRSQDRCDPREMTTDEIELLWNRRAKLVERREWLLKRTYERVFPPGIPRKHIFAPSIMRAIPLFPLHMLLERSSLFEKHSFAEVPNREGFPLSKYNIKTASDSIYTCWFDKDVPTPKEAYGELNTFGQVSYFKDIVSRWIEGDMQIDGIALFLELKDILYMIKFLGKWYKNIGFWGIIKFTLDIENCRDAAVYCYSYEYRRNDRLSNIKLDNNIKIERQLYVSEIIDNSEAIIENIFQEYLWDCGLKPNQVGSVPIGHWIEEIKKSAGLITCPKCRGQNISIIDEICKNCRSID